MKRSVWKRLLLIACTVICTLCMLTQGVFASEVDDLAFENPQETEAQPETEPEEDNNDEILGAITSLPDQIIDGIISAIVDAMDRISNAAMDGFVKWLYSVLLTVAETVFSYITSSTSNIFNYSWFQVTVGLFSRFGMLLFAVGVVLAFVDVGIEYRRRGADLSGAMLNFGKGLMAVGLFSTVPVPLFNFCVNIQSVILRTLSINWSFRNIIDALIAHSSMQAVTVIMLIVMIVLMFIIYFDSLKRGGILLVQICVGSLYMLSVPRGYMDNFYGWCKQVIALCVTVLFQNLLMFYGLMIVPTNPFLGIGTMFAAKEVPRICAQFGLDTSTKASFTNMATGANASIQAVKAAITLLV